MTDGNPPPPAADGIDGPDVFVSYSRADEAFVRRLDAALRVRGKDVWVDWEDIPASADWQARIFGGIDASRVFLAVLSPDLVASEICREELTRATGSNKRIVPVLRRDVDRRATPRELLVPNWIFFREGDDFESSVERLVETLDTDLEWLDAHTRLLVRAVEWDRERRDSSFLLRGRDLHDAEAWLAEQGSHREAATPLQTEYILASRNAASRRQRTLLGGVSLALAVAIGLGVLALLQRNDAIDQSQISRSRELAAGAVSQLPSDPEVSLLLARKAVEERNTPQAESALLRALRESHLRLTIGAGTGQVTSARFSPDGSQIVTAAGKTAAVRDARTGKLLALLRGHDGRVNAARFSPDGTRVVTASADRTARVWDARTGKTIAVLRGHRAAVGDAVFSPDGTRVLTASDDGRGSLWSARTGRKIAFLPAGSEVTDAIFSRDGRRAVTTTHDGLFEIWDGRTGKRLLRVRAFREPVYSPSFSPDGKLLLTADWSDVRVWNARTGRLVKILHAHEAGSIEIWVKSAQFSENGWYAVTAGADGTAIVWAVPAWRQIAVLRGHSGTVLRAEFSADTKRVVTVGDDGTARVWDSITGEAVAVLRVPGSRVLGAEPAPDGNRIVTATDDGVRIWEASGFVPLRSIKPQAGPPARTDFYVDDAVFAPDGHMFATLAERPRIDLWSVASGKRVLRLPGHGPAREWPKHLPIALAFSRDGSRIVTVADNGAIVWNAQNGALVSRLRGHPLWTARFTPDGQSVLTTGPDGWMRVWDGSTGKLRRSLKLVEASDSPEDALSDDGTRYAGSAGRHVAVWDVATGKRLAVLAGKLAELHAPPAFSPDGTRVYADGDDGTTGVERAGVWDAATGAVVSVFRSRDPIRAGVFSADGRLVLTRGQDTAEVWDARTGERVVALRGHGVSNVDSLSSASFSPDGRLVLTSGADGTAKVWDAGTGERIATLRQLPQVEGFSISSARFSPGGKLVLAVAGDTVNLYACEECGTDSELLRLADRRISRTATRADRERAADVAG